MTGPLSSTDRVLVAELQGVAARHASGQEQRNAAELGEEPGDPVADLHAVTTDRWLLTAAASVFVGDGADWYAPRAAALLERAGADLDRARVWRREHPPRAFRPPQT